MGEAPPRPADPGFLADLGSTLQIVRQRPLLLFVSLIVWAVPAFLPPALGILGLPIVIFSIGFAGTQRLWILRASRGEEFSWGEAFNRTWSYFGRFFVLGLLTFPVVAVGGILGWAFSRSGLGILFGVTASLLLLDFLLTFVTPALAFVTRRVSEALSIGIRMIWAQWPRSALYVLVPPFALLFLTYFGPGLGSDELQELLDAIAAGAPPESIRRSTPPPSISPAWAAITFVATLLGLWFKGAAALFFARKFEVGPFGASKEGEGPPPLPPRPDLGPG